MVASDPHHPPRLYRAVRAVLRPLVLGTVRPTVEGLERVPRTGPVILCSNHLSMLDPVIVPLVIDRPVVYLAKAEYFSTRPTAWFFSSLGVVPVDRTGGSAAQASIDRGVEVLRAGGVLSLFPEGTRSPDGRLYRGKTGPVRLAQGAGAPIVPIAMTGTREVMPPHAHIPRLSADVVVRFGDILHMDDLPATPEGLRAGADRLMGAIAALSGQEYVDAYAPTSTPDDMPKRP